MKQYTLTLIIFLLAIPAMAQQRQKPKGPATPLKPGKVHSFYRQPYRTRNSGSYGKDFNLLSVGYGFPQHLHPSLGGHSAIGPLVGKFEIPVLTEAGVAAQLQLASKAFRKGNYDGHIIGAGIGVLGIYHFNKFIPLKNLDVYASAGPGIRLEIFKYKDASSKLNKTSIYATALIMAGARYYFSPEMAAFIEAGDNDLSQVNLGLTLRL